MTKNIPVILLAFANDAPDQQGHLRHLDQEMRQLKQCLEQAERDGLCHLEWLPSATTSDIIAAFQRKEYQGKIAIFHYSGHADSFELLLKDEKGKAKAAHADGLMPFLTSQIGLQFVFLNGCYAMTQAKMLSDGGIPAVVGTLKAISDETATQLSLAFYKGLAAGLDLDTAWQHACLAMITDKGGDKSVYYHEKFRGAGFAEVSERFPWEIQYKPGSERAKHWSLPSAVGDYLFGLPELPEKYRKNLPKDPFRLLGRFETQDAAIFFGRNRDIRDLYLLIRYEQYPPLILLCGQSGVGKSSLLLAGLLPRIEASHKVNICRREQDKTLSQLLCAALGMDENEPSPEKWASAWVDRETQGGKPLVLVLDQAETVFTRPLDHGTSELPAFCAALQKMFETTGKTIKGRLVLSYRKEFHTEFQDAVENAHLPHNYLFLKKLDREGIVQVVQGLSTQDYLKTKYKLAVEAELPIVIADDLLVDQESAIAPVLQIILTKLWEAEKNKETRFFNRAQYEALRKKGVLLSDFFEQRMKEIRDWEQVIQRQVESSGLALDILNYHTTALGTAESRSMDDLLEKYQHQKDVLKALIQQFQTHYLLADVDGKQTTLAHDTLAPIVQKEMKNSDRPGQRALRILMAKVTDYEQNPDATVIEEEDLTLVERGAAGMRIWVQKEPELIEKSRIYRAKRQAERRRTRSLLWGAALLTGLFALAATFFGLNAERQKKRVETSNLFNEGRLLLTENPTEGLAKIRLALERDPSDSVKQRGYYDAIAHHIFYDSIWQCPSGFLNKVAFNSGANPFVFTTGNDVQSSYWKQKEGFERLFSAKNTICAIVISPNGSIAAGGEDRRVYVATPDGQRRIITPPGDMDSAAIRSMAFSPDGRWLAVGHNAPFASVFDLQTGKLERQVPEFSNANQTAVSPDGVFLLVGTTSGQVGLYPIKAGGGVYLKDGEGAPVTALAFSPTGQTIVAGFEDGKVNIWQKNKDVWRMDSIVAHKGAIQSLTFSPDGLFLLTASADHSAKLWFTKDWVLYRTLLGHGAAVHSVGFAADMSALFTASADGTVRHWPFVNPYPQQRLLLDSPVEQIGFSADGNWLLAAEQGPKILMWDGEDFTPKSPYIGHADRIDFFQISYDNQHVVSSDKSGNVQVWALESRNKKAEIKVEALSDIRIAPDGQQILLRNDTAVWFWNWPGGSTQGKPLRLPDQDDFPIAAAYSGDGKKMIVATLNQRLHYFDREGQLLESGMAPGEVSGLFAKAGSADVVLLTQPDSAWYVSDKRPMRLLSGSRKVRWDTQGNMASLLSRSGGQLCINAANQYPFIYFLSNGSSGVNDFDLHPKGRWLAAGVNENAVWLWRVPHQSMVKSAE